MKKKRPSKTKQESIDKNNDNEKCELCDMYFDNIKGFVIHTEEDHNEGTETDFEDSMNNSINDRNSCYEDFNNKIDKLLNKFTENNTKKFNIDHKKSGSLYSTNKDEQKNYDYVELVNLVENKDNILKVTPESKDTTISEMYMEKRVGVKNKAKQEETYKSEKNFKRINTGAKIVLLRKPSPQAPAESFKRSREL